jgi:hypothetical protein
VNSITAILTPDADGTLHIPVPPGLRGARVKVQATFEAADPADPAELARLRGFGAFKGKIILAPDFDDELADFREYME